MQRQLQSEIPDAEFRLGSSAGGEVRVIEVAIVTAIVTGVVSFLTAVLRFAEKRQVREVIVTGRSGWQVRVPAGTPEDQLYQLIDKAKEQDVELIEF